MDALARVTLRTDLAVVYDATIAAGRPVIKVVSHERWEAIAETIGEFADPVLRRANLLVSGVDLENSLGRVLRVGQCRLRINDETHPFERMDEQLPGRRAAMRPR